MPLTALRFSSALSSELRSISFTGSPTMIRLQPDERQRTTRAGTAARIHAKRLPCSIRGRSHKERQGVYSALEQKSPHFLCRFRSLLAKHPHTHLPSFDSRTREDFQDTLRQALRDIDERKPVVDVDGPNEVAVDLRFIGNRSDEIAGTDSRVPAGSHIETGHACLVTTPTSTSR